MNGVLYGVGVGPGDPELLTLKGARVIRACDVIAVPDSGTGEHVALEIARELVGEKPVLRCRLPMTRDAAELARHREEAADQICRELALGKSVAFLTLGDVTIYSTYAYLHRLVAARGFRAEMVAGVPSFCAAAAALGIALCEGDQALHVFPAGSAGSEAALELPGSKVLLKSGKQLPELLRTLERKKLLHLCALAQRVGMAEERLVPDLTNYDGEAGYLSTLILKEEL